MNRLVTVTAKIGTATRQALMELARKEDRTISFMVRRAVTQMLREIAPARSYARDKESKVEGGH